MLLKMVLYGSSLVNLIVMELFVLLHNNTCPNNTCGNCAKSNKKYLSVYTKKWIKKGKNRKFLLLDEK